MTRRLAEVRKVERFEPIVNSSESLCRNLVGHLVETFSMEQGEEQCDFGDFKSCAD